MAKLKGILDSKQKRMKIIKEELLDIKERFGEERRTEVIAEYTARSMEDLIADEDVVLTITHNGYIKRTNINTYRTQRRGGRGVQGAGSREEDFVEHLFTASTHSYILFFTDKGKCQLGADIHVVLNLVRESLPPQSHWVTITFRLARLFSLLSNSLLFY